VVAIRPEWIRLVAPGTPGSWSGRVVSSAYLGDKMELVLSLGDVELRAQAAPSLRALPGGELRVAIDAGACRVLPT
jgi:iron(III) transport system ATP-binding protein